jgi:threonine synthase
VKRESREIRPVKPNTVAKSLAIGNPADGYFAARLIPESGGWAEDCTDAEIVAGMHLLAETEGVFTETAGGVTVAVAQKLVQQGRIKKTDLTVLTITGNGLKTLDALDLAPPQVIEPKLAAFEAVFGGAYHVA